MLLLVVMQLILVLQLQLMLVLVLAGITGGRLAQVVGQLWFDLSVQLMRMLMVMVVMMVGPMLARMQMMPGVRMDNGTRGNCGHS